MTHGVGGREQLVSILGRVEKERAHVVLGLSIDGGLGDTGNCHNL